VKAGRPDLPDPAPVRRSDPIPDSIVDPITDPTDVDPTNPDPAQPAAHSVPDPKEEAFYALALRRILRNLWVFTLLLLPGAIWRFGWLAAAGFAAGGLVSWINFRSLAQGAQGLADRIVNLQSRERGEVVIARFLLRYVLVGVIAYGIFMGSPVAFRGFLWGLTLPVGGMLAEAGYEAFVGFGRGR
jgi:hypothetical protein